MDARTEVKAGLLRWRTDPVAFVVEVFGAAPEAWQVEALRAIEAHDRVAIRSGHGVGKSTLLAWVIIWFLMTRVPAKVPCTAAKAHQLEDVLWAELGKWIRRMPAPLQAYLELKSDKLEVRGAERENFAVARTARKENPEAFQGFHADHLLFLADEASGVEDVIFEVGEGAMSTPGAKTVLTGNPTRTQGYFYDAFHKMRRFWHCIHVPCSASTRVDPGFIEKMGARYGLDSNVYRVRVLGEFPTGEDSQVIPLHLIEAAVGRDVEVYPDAAMVWGLDIARFGDDSTALAKRKGNVVPEPVRSWRGADTMQTVGRVVDEYHNAMEKPVFICADVIGLGAGVVDRLREQGLPVRGISVSESAAVEDRYARLRDELWWRAREWFAKLDCRLCEGADDLVGELAGPSYTYLSTGKIKVESKDELKKRLGAGGGSPDQADAFCLTFAMGPVTKAAYRKKLVYDDRPWI